MHAIILAGGPVHTTALDRERIGHPALVVAADGGLRHAAELGLTPDTVIGDMDSVVESDLRAATDAGAAILRHPRRKDATDLELALDYVSDHGANDVLIVGAFGGRLDMSLANAALPARAAYRHLRVRHIDASSSALWLNGPDDAELGGAVGDRVSLIPMGGDASGIETRGLEYPLELETLLLGSTRGVSNRIVEAGARVALRSGQLLCLVTAQARKESR